MSALPGDDSAAVLALLGASGLTPSEAEINLLVRDYATIRASVSCLYRMPGVRHEEPADTFDPRVPAA